VKQRNRCGVNGKGGLRPLFLPAQLCGRCCTSYPNYQWDESRDPSGVLRIFGRWWWADIPLIRSYLMPTTNWCRIYTA